jgi:CheY-like chemotaxis protein
MPSVTLSSTCRVTRLSSRKDPHHIVKILLIDDEPDLRRIVTLSLSRLGGMDVLDAGDPDEGLALALRERPDGILLDVMMPEMDGPALLARLRANPGVCDIPVIFLTANVMPAEIARLRALGAAGVLTKPFDPTALPADVRRILQDVRTVAAGN